MSSQRAIRLGMGAWYRGGEGWFPSSRVGVTYNLCMSIGLGVSIAGLSGAANAPWASGPRAAIQWAADAGFRCIQLDATAAGLRPRELDRSGRRDITTLLKRLGLDLAGLDLWIPRDHFTEQANQARAISAVEAAVELVADLRGAASRAPVVSLNLPVNADPSLRVLLAAGADRQGVLIADHTVRTDEAALVAAEGPLGFGIDPAEAIRAGVDLPRLIARLGDALRSARLSDWGGTRRIAVGGRGRLDLLAYSASLSVSGYARPVIVDLRDIDDQARAASVAREHWPTMLP